jgi:hypothetical protein
MNAKFAAVVLVVVGLGIATELADASVILEFNNNPNNTVGGSPEIIQAAPGANIVISLQLVSTTETTLAISYWLSQFSGPASGVFSLIGRNRSEGDWNRGGFSDATVTSAADHFNNSQMSGFGQPDGIADNLLSPQNGPSLGTLPTGTNNPPGVSQVAIFTFAISLNAQPGLYEIRTYDYAKNGWTDENFNDHTFDAQAAIRVEVVPEPMVWSLASLGALVIFGFRKFRRALPALSNQLRMQRKN